MRYRSRSDNGLEDLLKLQAVLEDKIARDGIFDCLDVDALEDQMRALSEAFDVDEADIGDFEAWESGLKERIAENGFMAVFEEEMRTMLYVLCAGHVPKERLGQTFHAWLTADPVLRRHFDRLPPSDREDLRKFLRGESEIAEDILPYRSLERMKAWTRENLRACPEVLEGDGTPMNCLPDEVFRNWGLTVENRPAAIFFPRTRVGVQNLVLWARDNGKRVRMSGFAHTWSDLYSQDGEVLASVLPSYIYPDDPPSVMPPFDPDYYELQGIDIVGTVMEDGREKALCRIGAATSNEHFRQWSVANDLWTIPLNVILVEITFGGSNAMICHGAGLHNRTLSDLVASVEFVNANGEFQVVDDPDQLRAAAGCFGLLGVVTSITLKLDPMTYAVVKPTSKRVPLTIPPPPDFPVPACFDMSDITEEDLAEAWDEFVDRCENDYYAEWFWFPYQEECLINTWKNDGLAEEAQEFPSQLMTFLEFWGTYLMYIITSTLFRLLPGELQARIFGGVSMFFLTDLIRIDLDEEGCATTHLVNAIHFQRGIHNLRVLNTEVEIPIPPRRDDPTKPDWSVCQRAWWDALKRVCDRIDAPMRIALEMRIMGGSDVTMAPQAGNTFGTCAIEVLTNLNVHPRQWENFTRQVVRDWDSYRGPDHRRLKTRPHWAKQWQHLWFRGLPAIVYLKHFAYRDRLPEFREGLAEIADTAGLTLQDLQERFSNPVLDYLVFRGA